MHGSAYYGCMAKIELVSERTAQEICDNCVFRESNLGGFVCARLGQQIINRAVQLVSERHGLDGMDDFDNFVLVTAGQPKEYVEMTVGYWRSCSELSDRALSIMAQACAAAQRSYYVQEDTWPEDVGFVPPHLFTPQELTRGLFVEGI